MIRNAGTILEHDRVISNVRRHDGPAGAIAYSANVAYRYAADPSADHASDVVFVGSAYGGTVTMIAGAITTRVADPDRFGTFGRQWVDAFYADPS